MEVFCDHRMCSVTKGILKKKTHVLEPIFKKVAGRRVCKFIKRRLQHRCFQIFKNTYFNKHLQTAAFVIATGLVNVFAKGLS